MSDNRERDGLLLRKAALENRVYRLERQRLLHDFKVFDDRLESGRKATKEYRE